MLTGMNNGGLKLPGALAQFVNDQGQLDGFGPGTENRDKFDTSLRYPCIRKLRDTACSSFEDAGTIRLSTGVTVTI